MVRMGTIALVLSLALPALAEQTAANTPGSPAAVPVDNNAAQNRDQSTPPAPGAQTPPPGKPAPGVPGAPAPGPVKGVPSPPDVQGPEPRGGQPGPPPPPRRRGKDVNIQIELTISDQSGSAAPEKRVVSMIVADGASGRIRSNAFVAGLNVDARPEVLENDRVLVELGIEYKAQPAEGVPPPKVPAIMNESLTVILQNGKPQLVSQASDPASDRKLTIEVRASVMK